MTRAATVMCGVMCVVVALASARLAGAQGVTLVPAPPLTVPGLPVPIFGPPPPVPPATSSRDAQGHLTIRAVRLTAPLKIDGTLDEAVYASTPSISDFIQIEPKAGTPASQKTEFWLFFDDKNLYAVVRCYEDNLKGMISNEMRRDANILTQNEYVNFVIDTFYDRRNAQIFVVTPSGGRMDGQLTSERQYNGDWNPVWNWKAGRFDKGWQVETAIPFKSLRYRAGKTQVWGMHVSRYNRWKNEIDLPLPMPADRGLASTFQMSAAPTVVGIEAPEQGRIVELKPYVIGSLTSDRTARPAVNNELDANFGSDAKFGITDGTTADLTYNTDFAQVEADEQQINLTRFNLFFPEKRDFFLENQGVFSFGGVAASGGGDVPILFYSRRIGLNGAQVVPIHGGGRVTGRQGRWTFGMVDMQSKASGPVASTNFSVARVRRDLLRRSSVGAMFTGRSVGQSGVGSNQMYGADGVFAFYQNVLVNTYWARTDTTGKADHDVSYRAQLDYSGDRYGLQLEQMSIGANFNPEIGFVRRSDIRKSYGMARFSPRPKHIKSVRKFFFQGSKAYLENGNGRKELRDSQGEAAVEFQNSDRLFVNYYGFYEFIPVPFRIAPTVTVPVGGYDYQSGKVSFRLGQQRRFNGTASVEHGSLYGGTKTIAGFSGGRLKLSMKASIEPTVSFNHVELKQGTFDTNLIGSRITVTPTPLMFVSALIQYNSLAKSVASNVRFRWEYSPGSELFVVYNDQRDTRFGGFPDLANRSFIVKVNRFIRF